MTSVALGGPFREHYHACAFVNGPADERAVVEPFFIEGMQRGEKAVYIVDPEKRQMHADRLGACAPAEGLHEVTTWNEAHLKGGSFDQDRMMTALDEWIHEHART